jgi:hypothetical protein
MLTHVQDENSSYHKEADPNLFTTYCVQKINGYELAHGAAITEF